jgi:hypothetical protein
MGGVGDRTVLAAALIAMHAAIRGTVRAMMTIKHRAYSMNAEVVLLRVSALLSVLQ